MRKIPTNGLGKLLELSALRIERAADSSRRFRAGKKIDSQRLLYFRRSWGWYAVLVAISWLVAVPVFVRLTAQSSHADIMAHALLSKTVVEHGQGLSYSFWYPTIYFFSGGATSSPNMRMASVVLLTLLITLKALIVFKLAHWHTNRVSVSFIIAACAIVISPIMNPNRAHDIYLGQISATIWHNSTTVLLEPFALIAFVAGLYFLRNLTYKSGLIFSAGLVIATLAKPNYTLAFLPVFAVAVVAILVRSRCSLKRLTGLAVVALFPSAVTLACQFLSTYKASSIVSNKIVISPFAVWNIYSTNIPLSIALSLIGPLAIFLALPADRKVSLPILLSWATTLVSISQLTLFAESGPGGAISSTGNWFWGSYVSVFILFVVSMIEFARGMTTGRLSRTSVVSAWVAGLALTAHVISGTYYFLNIGMPGYPDY